MSQNTQDYSWAEYLDCMEGGGTDVLSLPAPLARRAGAGRDQPLWGVLAALGVTLVSLWLSKLNFWPFTVQMASGRAMHPVEPVMIAIVLGMIIGNAWRLPKALQPGLKFSVKKVLPLGIVLLGARLHFGDLMKVGLS